MLPRATVEHLLRIASHAQKFERKLPAVARPQPPTASPPTLSDPLDDCELPMPQPITDKLIALGINAVVAMRVSEGYMRSAMKSKAVFERQYRNICIARRRIGPSVTEAGFVQANRIVFLELYTRTMRKWADHIMKIATSCLCGRSQDISQMNEDVSRRPFNKNAVPLLVEFFESNAFPSRTEREELARQSGMDQRQVDVWFQNRRRRCKKDGKELRSGNILQGLPADIGETFAEILSEDEGKIDPGVIDHLRSNETSWTRSPDMTDMFNFKRPAHAYPSAYPPVCSYEPFRKDGTIPHLSTPWQRRAFESPARVLPPADVTTLIEMFAKLKVSDQTYQTRAPNFGGECTQKLHASEVQPSATTNTGIITVPPRAPMPSFLRATPRVNLVANRAQYSHLKTLFSSDATTSNSCSALSESADRILEPPRRTTALCSSASAAGPHPSLQTGHSHPGRRGVTGFSAFASTPITLLSPVSLPTKGEASMPAVPVQLVTPVAPSFDANKQTKQCGRNDTQRHGYAPYPSPKCLRLKRKIADFSEREHSLYNSSPKLSSMPPLSSPAPTNTQASSVRPMRAASATPSVSSVDSDAPSTPPLLPVQLCDTSIPDSISIQAYKEPWSLLDHWLSYPGEESAMDSFPALDFKEPLLPFDMFSEPSISDFKQPVLDLTFLEPVIVDSSNSNVSSTHHLA